MDRRWDRVSDLTEAKPKKIATRRHLGVLGTTKTDPGRHLDVLGTTKTDPGRHLDVV
jgi:hypothetical protein